MSNEPKRPAAPAAGQKATGRPAGRKPSDRRESRRTGSGRRTRYSSSASSAAETQHPPAAPPVRRTPVAPVAVEDLEADYYDDEEEYSSEEYEKLLELYRGSLRSITEGEIITGRVVRVTPSDVVVDVGYKSEGIIPIDEFGDVLNIRVGDEIEVLLENLENQDGQVALSKKRADFMKVWDRLKEIYERGEVVEGRTQRRIKGGLVVDLLGIDAFLPGSQIDIKQIRDFDEHVGRSYQFKIIKVNKLRKNIVVSRRAVLEEERLAKREEMIKTIAKGAVLEGMVKNITDYGVFIDLGGLDGLLHITDMSWSRVNHPSEMVALGDKITVKVLDFDEDMKRISLGLKQLTKYPWDDIEKNYPKGARIRGKVVNIADYGAFVELKEGVEGLIHISEMSWSSHIKHPSQILQVGDLVEAVVLNVDKENERISLGLKQKQEDPWNQVSEKYSVGSKAVGRVRNITNFGAFVELEEGIDGLIHISDMSWTKKIRHPSEIMKKNDNVEVKILSIDKENRRISLGHKQIQSDPWDALEERYSSGTLVTGKILRLLDRGAIVELPDGVDGFLPVSQMATADVRKPSELFNKGDKIPLAVKHFDKKERKIILSILGYFEGKEKQEIEEYLRKNPIKSVTFEELIKSDYGKKELERLLSGTGLSRSEKEESGPEESE